MESDEHQTCWFKKAVCRAPQQSVPDFLKRMCSANHSCWFPGAAALPFLFAGHLQRHIIVTLLHYESLCFRRAPLSPADRKETTPPIHNGYGYKLQ